MAAVAFEPQHRVDHMFEHARPRDGPVLGHMPDQHHRAAALLGEADQLLRRGADLADRARRAVDEVAVHGLDRIDHHQRGRLAGREGGEDVAHAGCGGELDRRSPEPEPKRAQTHLVGGFLA